MQVVLGCICAACQSVACASPKQCIAMSHLFICWLSGGLQSIVQLLQDCQVTLEGSVVQVSLQPSAAPNKCIVSFAMGPPVLIEIPAGNIKPLPALIMGESAPAICHAMSHRCIQAASLQLLHPFKVTMSRANRLFTSVVASLMVYIVCIQKEGCSHAMHTAQAETTVKLSMPLLQDARDVQAVCCDKHDFDCIALYCIACLLVPVP